VTSGDVGVVIARCHGSWDKDVPMNVKRITKESNLLIEEYNIHCFTWPNFRGEIFKQLPNTQRYFTLYSVSLATPFFRFFEE